MYPALIVSVLLCGVRLSAQMAHIAVHQPGVAGEVRHNRWVTVGPPPEVVTTTPKRVLRREKTKLTKVQLKQLLSKLPEKTSMILMKWLHKLQLHRWQDLLRGSYKTPSR